MLKSLRAAIASALLLAFLATGLVQAATLPSISNLVANPSVWSPTAGKLEVKAQMSAGGKWHLDLVNICTAKTLRMLDGTLPAAGEIKFSIDGTSAPAIESGILRLQLTPATSAGSEGLASSVVVRVGDDSAAVARQVPLCENAERFQTAATSKAEVVAAALQASAHFPGAQQVMLVAQSKSLGLSAVATVAAGLRKWPVLLTTKDTLSYPTKTWIKHNQVKKVLLIGDESVISSAVAKKLRGLGVAVARKATKSPNALAAMLYSKSTFSDVQAVFANLDGERKSVLQAVSYAVATRRPLIHLTNSNQAEVRLLISKWSCAGGLAIANDGEIQSSILESVAKAERIGNVKLTASTLALSRAVEAEIETLSVVDPSVKPGQVQLISLSYPQLLLAVSDSGLNAAQRAWLNSRGDVVNVVVNEQIPMLSDGVAADVAHLILARGEPTKIELMELGDLGALQAPPTFAFSGAGWGHGIGMSQWGAYQLGMEGKSAAEILQYYFQGTTVKPAPADADIFVSLQNRISNVKLQVLPLSGSTPSWRLEASVGDQVVGTVKLSTDNTVNVKWNDASGKLNFSFTGPGSPSLPAANSVKIKWSGTRFAGDLGTEPGVIQVAGPDETLTIGQASSGRRYRFGLLKLTGAPATSDYSAGVQVVNRLRLADEYMYGLGEVSSSWPEATLQAQVIAARSYAYYDAYNKDGSTASVRGVCACQVWDDIRDQNFVGWSKLAESVGPRWKAAVDATLGDNGSALVVMAGSQVAHTYYAASTGGWTQNNEDVWGGTAIPYLRAVPDPYSLIPDGAAALARWSPRVRAQEMVAKAFGLSAVATLDFSDRFESGGVRNVTATSPDGKTATITGEQFRSRVRSDTGVTLNSSWIWRSAMTPRLTGRLTATDLIDDLWFGYAKVPAATSKLAVIVTQAKDSDPSAVAIAAAFAGAKGAFFLPIAKSGDVGRASKYLLQQKITDAILVGDVDSALLNKLNSSSINYRAINAGTTAGLSTLLANELGALADVVLASDDDPTAWPLAVSLATRKQAPLLMLHGNVLSPELSLWLATQSPANTIAVGSTSALPDSALAGLPNPKRLNTADLALASLIAARISTGVVRGVALADGSVNTEAALVAASTGLPVIYLDEQLQGELLAWLRRQSLAAVVIDLGADAELVQQIRRA